jgi:hypothetical protein
MMRSGASGETDGLCRRGRPHGGSRLTHTPTSRIPSTIRCARATERARRIKTKRPVVRLAHSSQVHHALLREKVPRPQHSSFDR